jgi:CRISPR-associated protein Cas1
MNGFPLVIDRKESRISFENDTIVVRTGPQDKQSIPLHLISELIVYGKASVESDVWRHLAEHNITAVILPSRGKGDPAFLGAGLTNSLPIRFAQYDCYQNPKCREDYAHQLIYLKYIAQNLTLEQLGSDRLTNIIPLEPVTLGQLLGIEGTLARQYFAQIKPQIEAHWNFNGRNRQPPKDPLNALLSLSYTLLTAVMQRVIQQFGLDPWLGIYHQPYPGRPALAIDLIEPIRPELDLWVIQILHEHFEPQAFTNTEQDGCRLDKDARGIYFHQWADLNANWRDGKTLEQYCRVQVEQFTKFIKFSPYNHEYLYPESPF